MVLASAWIAMWAAYLFAGRPTPVEPEAFKLVAALDLSLMVPALTLGGVLIWGQIGWGYVVAAIASIQGALYLFVLTVNSVVAVHRGLANTPGEIPIWGTLTIFMASTAFVLLANIRRERVPFAPVASGDWSDHGNDQLAASTSVNSVRV